MMKRYQHSDGQVDTRVLANTATLFVTAFFSSALMSCGGGGGGGDVPQAQSAVSGNLIDLPDNTISRLGMIYFSAADAKGLAELGLPSGVVGASAEFVDFHQTLGKAYLDSVLSIDDIDTCNITIDSTDDSQDVGLKEDHEFTQLEINSSLVSAGNTLSILTPSGSWPDLVITDYSDLYYEFQTDGSMLGDLPPGSTISIPGDEFPAFEEIQIPTVTRFTEPTLLNVVEGRITPETQVTWAVQDNSTTGGITAITSYNDVTDDANASELTIEIDCTVEDDGEFSFPDNVRQLLTKYDLLTEDFILSRHSVTSEVQGDAAVMVVNSAIYFF